MSNEHNDDILRDAEETRDNQNHPQDDGYEEFCFMCRRPESQTGKLIHLPGNLCVCSHCMQNAFDSFQNSGLQYSDLMDISGMMMPIYDNAAKKSSGTDHGTDDDSEEKKDAKKSGDKKNRGPNISMMFMNPMQEQGRYKVKKKSEEEKAKERAEFDIRSIPAPHQIKQQLDEYVVGQEIAFLAFS